jgi:uncharacterized protein YjlB
MATLTQLRPDMLLLDRDGWIPNSAYPVLIWRNAIATVSADPADAFETRFATHGWTNSWRDGIYDYHHFHSTAHEVLGFARGRVHVQLGGPHGPVHAMGPGDVIAIPAGVGHCNVGSSEDLLVVGAYGDGRDFDICREDADPARVRTNLATLPAPSTDPLDGGNGALITQWLKRRGKR